MIALRTGAASGLVAPEKTNEELLREIEEEDLANQIFEEELEDHVKGYFETRYHNTSKYSRSLIYGSRKDFYNNVTSILVLITGITQGIKTYGNYENDPVIEIVELFIIYAFAADVVLKIHAESIRPLRFFYGPNYKWNIFDLLVVSNWMIRQTLEPIF